MWGGDALEHAALAATARGGWRGDGDELLRRLGHGDLLASPCGCSSSAPPPALPPSPLPARPLREVGAGEGEADLARLHHLLQWLHELQATRPESFREAYATTTREAVQLARTADFSRHSLPRMGALPSVLHFAAGCGCLEACAAILARCGRLNFAIDPSGQTPLFWAAQSGLCNTLRLLLRHGAEVMHLDDAGESPLHIAAARGLAESCRALLAAPAAQRRGPEVALELRSARGLTPLHAASTSGHLRVAEVLLEAGARADAETSEGRTALHLAAMEGHDALTERLLAAHPELQSREDMHGWRALDYARERGWPVAGELLRSEDQVFAGATWTSFMTDSRAGKVRSTGAGLASGRETAGERAAGTEVAAFAVERVLRASLPGALERPRLRCLSGDRKAPPPRQRRLQFPPHLPRRGCARPPGALFGGDQESQPQVSAVRGGGEIACAAHEGELLQLHSGR
mmetsp:Transcript_153528/g.490831  ORF Transcript_153528/g.490831 Transcript_153528/m.490831 type:complete len:461 (+) Transcript_153528:171-1553(+)